MKVGGPEPAGEADEQLPREAGRSDQDFENLLDPLTLTGPVLNETFAIPGEIPNLRGTDASLHRGSGFDIGCRSFGPQTPYRELRGVGFAERRRFEVPTLARTRRLVLE